MLVPIVGYAVAKTGVELDATAVALTVVSVLGPTFRPREIVVVAELPKTQSGKIVRRLIRQKYLGEELGDDVGLAPGSGDTDATPATTRKVVSARHWPSQQMRRM